MKKQYSTAETPGCLNYESLHVRKRTFLFN